MAKLSLRDIDLQGKRVLMRVDFNVPLSKERQITDDSRISAALPSIQYVLQAGASLILMSHLGRPEGKPEAKYSLSPCAKRLSEMLGREVLFAKDCVGPEVEKQAHKLPKGDVLLLENLRFHEGEEHPEKDPSFVKALAKLGDIYVNDAFGTAHRAHASTAQIASFFPHKAVAGFLMQKEIESLSPLLQNPNRPFFALLGGAKVSTKIGVIRNLLPHVDTLFIGGAMAFTFLKSQGISTGDSPIEEAEVPTAQKLLQDFPQKIQLACDFVVARAYEKEAETQIVTQEKGIPPGWQGMDIGPQTIAKWQEIFQKAATFFWNGPVGVFEMPRFAQGTQKIAQCLAALKGTTIVGGGDSVAAVQQTGLASRFTHLSTGGGASLEFLELGHLPGIDALSEKRDS